MNIERLENEIKEKIGCTVERTKAFKDCVEVDALTLGDGDFRPVIYPDRISEDELDHFIENLKSEMDNIDEMRMTIIDGFKNLDQCKDKLMICLSRKCEDEAVRRDFLDVSKYVRIVDGSYSARVNDKMLDLWDITEDELFEIAENNMEYTATPIEDMLLQLMIAASPMPDVNEEEIREFLGIGDTKSGLTVVTTPDTMYGAGTLCCNKMLEELAEKLDSDLVVIPSSIHEVLVFPKVEGADEDTMRNMVEQVNSTQVAPSEVLSDNVYVYTRSTKELKVA